MFDVFDNATAPNICDVCGTELSIGDWPLCGGKHTHAPSRLATIPDDWPGGKTFTNLDHDPVTVYSRSELKREMDKRGLQPFVRHTPPPDSDKSKMTQRFV